MSSHPPSYRGYRFPAEIISYAVWLYHCFGLSFRDVEDLLAERGVTVTYEAIRQWCRTFGLDYAGRLRRRRGRMGDTWHLDEVFVKIQGRQQYLWRAVDEDGDTIDILVQSRRNRRAALRFFRKLLKGQGCVPTDSQRVWNQRGEGSHDHIRRLGLSPVRPSAVSIQASGHTTGLYRPLGGVYGPKSDPSKLNAMKIEQ